MATDKKNHSNYELQYAMGIADARGYVEEAINKAVERCEARIVAYLRHRRDEVRDNADLYECLDAAADSVELGEHEGSWDTVDKPDNSKELLEQIEVYGDDTVSKALEKLGIDPKELANALEDVEE